MTNEKLKTIDDALGAMEKVTSALHDLGADWPLRRRALEVSQELVDMRTAERQRLAGTVRA